MKLLKLWEADLHKLYELQSSFEADENGFMNFAYGYTLEEYADYVQLKKRHEQSLDLPNGYVPDTAYVLVDEEDYVGLFNLRHYLNDALKEGAGHIGYGIGKKYRGHGYATAGLALTIEEAKKIIPEDEIYISVHKDNPASLTVQKKNGAIIHHEDETSYYTRIKI